MNEALELLSDTFILPPQRRGQDFWTKVFAGHEVGLTTPTPRPKLGHVAHFRQQNMLTSDQGHF